MYFESQITLNPVLWGVRSLANYIAVYERLFKTESPIFILLCVLFFQRQSFKFIFYFIAAGVKSPVLWRLI